MSPSISQSQIDRMAKKNKRLVLLGGIGVGALLSNSIFSAVEKSHAKRKLVQLHKEELENEWTPKEFHEIHKFVKEISPEMAKNSHSLWELMKIVKDGGGPSLQMASALSSSKLPYSGRGIFKTYIPSMVPGVQESTPSYVVGRPRVLGNPKEIEKEFSKRMIEGNGNALQKTSSAKDLLKLFHPTMETRKLMGAGVGIGASVIGLSTLMSSVDKNVKIKSVVKDLKVIHPELIREHGPEVLNRLKTLWAISPEVFTLPKASRTTTMYKYLLASMGRPNMSLMEIKDLIGLNKSMEDESFKDIHGVASVLEAPLAFVT